MILPFGGATPQVSASAFVAPDAWVIGDVDLGENVSVFFGAVLRGDILPIRVGRGTNLQEHALVHTSHGRMPTSIGEQVTVGHRAIVHGCTIGSRCLIGMGSIILDDTIVEDECVIAAGSVVPEKKRFPARSMIMGVPGKVVRMLGEADLSAIRLGAERYVALGAEYRKAL